MNNHPDDPNVWRDPRTTQEAFGPEWGKDGWITKADHNLINQTLWVAILGLLFLYPTGKLLGWW